MIIENLSNLLKKLAEIADKSFEEEDAKPVEIKRIEYLEYWARRAQILNTIIEILNYCNGMFSSAKKE